jgi:hypothetical protein
LNERQREKKARGIFPLHFQLLQVQFTRQKARERGKKKQKIFFSPSMDMVKISVTKLSTNHVT